MHKRDRTLERACDKAIMATLLYRSIFSATLSFHQLYTFLLSDIVIDPSFLKKRLATLVRSKKLALKDGKYFIKNTKVFSWDSRAKNSKALLSSALPTIELLSHIKWIKMLAVTGSVAAYNATKEDDIDIFIVTQRNRLWLTRFFTVLILKAVNKYRSDANSSGKICPNIFVDESNLAWNMEKRSVYVAHEILLMHPIINRDDIYFKFIRENKWVFEHFKGFPVNHDIVSASITHENSRLDWLEGMLMRLQMFYMRKKITTETATKNIIHFNKKDHSVLIMDAFQETLLNA